ncbi:uncharacterized protein [Euphorbia lathyris]|uniref:uncharacterized protein n=1 Tax=Euphorbia lathyris TaxID=212925 RepID=UPI003313DA07
MRREEKRRKFHDSLLNTLYPPRPQPQSKADDETPNNTTFDVNLIPDDYGLRTSSTSSSDNEDGESECAQQKLTRSQRKRLRKQKLKEDVSRRKQVIGPLLPSPSDGGIAGEQCSPPVRQNADESCGSQSKLKQRRMAKKLGKERLKPSDIKDSVPVINGENSDDGRKLRAIDVHTCEESQSSS